MHNLGILSETLVVPAPPLCDYRCTKTPSGSEHNTQTCTQRDLYRVTLLHTIVRECAAVRSSIDGLFLEHNTFQPFQCMR